MPTTKIAAITGLLVVGTSAQSTFQSLGRNTACRGPDGENNPAFFSRSPGQSAQECANVCGVNSECTGFEFQNAGVCEFWNAPIESFVTVRGLECFEKVNRAPQPTPAPAPSPQPSETITFRTLGDNTVCRGANPNDNNPDFFTVVPSTGIQDCAQQCADIDACNGIEVGPNNKCELWTAPIGATASLRGNRCFLKTGNAPAPTANPEDEPAQAPAPAAVPLTLDIRVQFPDNSLNANQKRAFEQARQSLLCFMRGATGTRNFRTTITATGRDIDGPGRVLGSAGPSRIIRDPRTGFVRPVTGNMQFDTSDLSRMERDGTLEGVILHEMMHVMGLGTLWINNGCANAGCRGSTNWNGDQCPAAQEEFLAMGGTGQIPLADTGGAGTACGHWRERVFRNEVATGFAELFMPLSRMTVQSFKDIGYDTDLNCREIDQDFNLRNARRIERLQDFSMDGEVLETSPEEVEMTEEWWQNRREGKPMAEVPITTPENRFEDVEAQGELATADTAPAAPAETLSNASPRVSPATGIFAILMAMAAALR